MMSFIKNIIKSKKKNKKEKKKRKRKRFFPAALFLLLFIPNDAMPN
jgi:hypothetical protein